MRASTTFFCQAVLGLAEVSAATYGRAASLAVLPVRVELNGSKPIAALTVRNTGSEATVVQLEARQWTQTDGEDVYAPTREILATPPIFTVPPGGSQIVRVGLRRAPDAGRELSYRLFLQEVPPPPPPGFQGMRVVLRFGVPVFVADAGSARTAPVSIGWKAQSQGNAMLVSATNSSPSHIELTHLDIAAGSSAKKSLFRGDVQTYLLPGQTHAWKLRADPPISAGTTLDITATSDAGPIRANALIAAH